MKIVGKSKPNQQEKQAKPENQQRKAYEGARNQEFSRREQTKSTRKTRKTR